MKARAVLVTTTVDDRRIAGELARAAVQARLAGCGQVGGPISSSYWWDGAIEDAQEWTVVLKTTADRADALVEHLVAAHPYDVPEVLVTAVTGGNPGYLEWLEQQTRPL
jgi:periplasmic divalent cation tolerance protein